MSKITIHVDEDACSGHGRCYTLFPSLFEPDDQGHSTALASEVDASSLQDATSAAANCPEGAIHVNP